MKTALVAVTEKGWQTAGSIRSRLPDSDLCSRSTGVRDALEKAWSEYDAIICVMAAGIAVRCIAGLCTSKFKDPCIIVLDEEGKHVISLLSGHIGGGNELARKIADVVGGTAVITTASDVAGHTPLDLWSIEQNCTIGDPHKLALLSAKLLNEGSLKLFQEHPFVKNLPDDFIACTNPDKADIVMSLNVFDDPDRLQDKLHLIPRVRYIGFGCRRGAELDDFRQVIDDLQHVHGLDLRSVAGIASIDIKNDEAGLLEVRRLYNWPIRFFSKDKINTITVPGSSQVVYEKIGVHSVSEAAAVLAASTKMKQGRLIIEKKKWKSITAAVAETAY